MHTNSTGTNLIVSVTQAGDWVLAGLKNKELERTKNQGLFIPWVRVEIFFYFSLLCKGLWLSRDLISLLWPLSPIASSLNKASLRPVRLGSQFSFFLRGAEEEGLATDWDFPTTKKHPDWRLNLTFLGLILKQPNFSVPNKKNSRKGCGYYKIKPLQHPGNSINNFDWKKYPSGPRLCLISMSISQIGKLRPRGWLV